MGQDGQAPGAAGLQHGGNPRDLHLAGQEYNGSVWSISKMNLLLHGIPDADMQHGDTLAEPMHVHGGQLDRFDRVLSNPPFSLNYTRDGMEHPERFRWGWAPEGGKKADLMFVQHMVSVLKGGRGIAATVMPHGVHFRTVFTASRNRRPGMVRLGRSPWAYGSCSSRVLPELRG